MIKNEGNEIGKKYCDFLKGEITEIEKSFEETLKDSFEFYGGYTDSYDLEVSNLQEERKSSLLWWFITATERGVSEENLKEVFGEDYQDLLVSSSF